MAKIQPQSVGLAPELPRHIGIIMDGNGRYATRRGLPRKLGHRAGMERLRGLIRFSSDIGIEVLSLYAFSTENWKRPKEEIGALFDLFLEYFISELDDLDKNNVCIRIMGDMSAFPEKMGQETDEAMYKTRNNTGLKLNIALNYGSRAEVVRACNTLIERGKPVDEADLMNALYTAGLPDLDLDNPYGGRAAVIQLHAASGGIRRACVHGRDISRAYGRKIRGLHKGIPAAHQKVRRGDGINHKKGEAA